MKNGKLIMLPLLSATFLLSSCNNVNPDKSSSNSDKSDNTSSFESSSEDKKNSNNSSSNSTEEGADTNLEILKKAVSNTVSKNGFKSVASPIKTTVAGKKYESSAADADAIKKTNWDAIINVDSLTYSSTHLNDDFSLEEINQSLKIDDLNIQPNKYGIAPLFMEHGAVATNKAIAALDISTNFYYAGEAYKDRLYYDDYNSNGEESDLGLLVEIAKNPMLKKLDEAGYSVYKNDDVNQGPSFSINPKGYLQLTIDEAEEDTSKTDVISYDVGDLVLDFLSGTTIEFNDNFISTKSGSTYTLSVNFSSKEVKDCVNDFIDSLDDDWEFKLPVEEDSPFADIVVTKETLKTISEKVFDSLEVKKFDYSINYNENKLISSKLDFDLTIDDSVYESYLKNKESDDEDTTSTVVGVSSLNFSSSIAFSTYEKTSDDASQEKLSEHLWDFAGLPSKEDLADENKYPLQELPKKKETTQE